MLKRKREEEEEKNETKAHKRHKAGLPGPCGLWAIRAQFERYLELFDQVTLEPRAPFDTNMLQQQFAAVWARAIFRNLGEIPTYTGIQSVFELLYQFLPGLVECFYGCAVCGARFFFYNKEPPTSRYTLPHLREECSHPTLYLPTFDFRVMLNVVMSLGAVRNAFGGDVLNGSLRPTQEYFEAAAIDFRHHWSEAPREAAMRKLCVHLTDNPLDNLRLDNCNRNLVPMMLSVMTFPITLCLANGQVGVINEYRPSENKLVFADGVTVSLCENTLGLVGKRFFIAHLYDAYCRQLARTVLVRSSGRLYDDVLDYIMSFIELGSFASVFPAFPDFDDTVICRCWLCTSVTRRVLDWH